MCLFKKDRFDQIVTKMPGNSFQPHAKRRLKRMDRYQKKILETEFAKDTNWSHKKVVGLAARLKILPIKVYKWNWD